MRCDVLVGWAFIKVYILRTLKPVEPQNQPRRSWSLPSFSGGRFLFLINTRLQPGDECPEGEETVSTVFCPAVIARIGQAVETASASSASDTGLKPGANGRKAGIPDEPIIISSYRDTLIFNLKPGGLGLFCAP